MLLVALLRYVVIFALVYVVYLCARVVIEYFRLAARMPHLSWLSLAPTYAFLAKGGWQSYRDQVAATRAAAAKQSDNSAPLVTSGVLAVALCAVVDVADPDAFKAILNDPDTFPKGPLSGAGGFLVGEGLATSTGARWKKDRRMLTPVFHFRKLRSYVPTMNKHARLLSDRLGASKSDDNAQLPLVKQFSLSTVVDAVMGNVYDADYVSKTLTSIIDNIPFVLGVTTLGPRVWGLVPGKWGAAPLRQVSELRQGICDHVDQVMAKLDENEQTGNDGADDDDDIDDADVVTLMARARDDDGSRLSKELICDHAMTFLFAGNDTTSGMMSWTMLALATHPEHQETARKEILEVVGAEGDVTSEHLPRLKFVRACFEEAIRLHSPVPFLDRTVGRDGISLCGTELPKGTFLLLNFQSVQGSATQFRDPETFNPYRFVSDHADFASDRHAFSYLPFSGGPRNCIGRKMAINGALTAFAHILRRYEIRPTAKTNHECVIKGVLEPANLYLNFVERK